MSSKRLLPLFIFVFVTLVIGILRLGIIYLPNDPGSIKHMEETLLSQPIGSWDLFNHHVVGVWYDDGNPAREYRPLNSVICVGMFLLRDYPSILIFTSSALLGIAAMLVYILAMEITQKRVIALCSAFLFTLTVPSIAMTWIVINKQPLVPIFIVFGLLCYVRYTKYDRTTWLYLLWATCFIGPLFRELTGILPLTVLLVTLAEGKWDKRILIPLPILLFHGIFPSFIINLLFYGHIALTPVFSRGYMSVNEMSFLSSLGHLKWRMPPHFVLLLPPILTILAASSAVLYGATKIRVSSERLRRAIVIIGLGFVMTFFLNKASYIPITFIVAFASFRFGKLLPIWFLVSWLPFFKIYSMEVHLITAVIPWTIMVLLWVEYLFERMQERMEVSRMSLLRLLACAALVIAFLDHSLNLVAVHSTFSEISKGVVGVADWLKTNTKGKCVLVTNFSGGISISAAAGEKVRNYWTPGSGPTGWQNPEDTVTPSEFEQMVKKLYASQDIYLLEHIGRQSRRFHQYLDVPPCGKPEFVIRFNVKSSFPFLDPFKNVIPRRYMAFTGPPDLKGEFQKARGLFHREIFAVYDLHKLNYSPGAGSKWYFSGYDSSSPPHRLYSPSPPPPLTVLEDYRGFNVIFYGEKYYGLALDEGPFDIGRIEKKDYRQCFVGNTKSEVKHLIKEYLKRK